MDGMFIGVSDNGACRGVKFAEICQRFSNFLDDLLRYWYKNFLTLLEYRRTSSTSAPDKFCRNEVLSVFCARVLPIEMPTTEPKERNRYETEEYEQRASLQEHKCLLTCSSDSLISLSCVGDQRYQACRHSTDWMLEPEMWLQKVLDTAYLPFP